VTRRPRSAGYEVIAPTQPMRRLERDALSPADVLGRIADPVVIAGHSYAGAVISHPEVAAAGNVVGLARRPGVPAPRKSPA
jgi:hypothetical protein